jgi:pimeloyl-ACP methyl ester carboxylesterase
MKQSIFIIAAILLGLLLGSCSESKSPPEQEDFSFVLDEKFRGERISVSFPSQGHIIKGFVFRGKGPGPHPTIILLHGFPGNDQDVLGLGQVIPQTGWNVLVFNYRGTWASEGEATPLNSLMDVRAAIDFVKKAETRKRFNIDPDYLYLGGYSYGGCLSIAVAADVEFIRGVIFIAGANMHYLISEMEKQTDFGKQFAEGMRQWYSSPQGRGTDFNSVLKEVIAKKEKFDIIKHASRIADRKIVIIGGWQDKKSNLEDHILPFYRALTKAGAKNISPFILDDNHDFKRERFSIQNIISTWLYLQHH